MTYCDYDFYVTEYYGNIITESDFIRFASRATDKLNYLTLNRISYANDLGLFLYLGDIINDATVEKIKKCVCRLAEVLYEIDLREKTNRETIGFESTENGQRGKVISSVSSGSESISYATSNNSKNSMIDAVLTDDKALKKIYTDIIREYLRGTGLLYAGL